MNPRLLRLRPWLVRSLIPRQQVGTYLLYAATGAPSYVGRSDTDLRQRLLRHCTDRRGVYFTFDVHNSPLNAFEMECALFHLLGPSVTNRIHPDHPAYQPARCSYCRTTQRTIRSLRLAPPGSRTEPPNSQSEDPR